MRIGRILSVLALVFLLGGCAGMNSTEQNVFGGGALGAGLGAAIGAASGGSPALGAAIGGAAGIVGGAIKDSWDRSNAYNSAPPAVSYYPY